MGLASRAGVAIALVVAGYWLLAAPCPAPAAGLRTGCDAARPAVAFRADAGALSPQPSKRPVPCLDVIDQRDVLAHT